MKNSAKRSFGQGRFALCTATIHEGYCYTYCSIFSVECQYSMENFLWNVILYFRRIFMIFMVYNKHINIIDFYKECLIWNKVILIWF